MSNAVSFLSTSVADVRSTLECQLIHDPRGALMDAQTCLAALPQDQHRSLRAVLKTIINKARKQLGE